MTKDQVESFDGVAIQYEMHGIEKPALVFVHGWCCNRGHWCEQFNELPGAIVSSLSIWQATADRASTGNHGRCRLSARTW
jgi:pimeloyl-ACP methyl ester carboxylesterase